MRSGLFRVRRAAVHEDVTAAELQVPAQGRLPGRTPTAVVDIGSNSIRLVVYEGMTRSPTPLYNEKVLAGLGEQVSVTGRLSEASIARALEALARFRALLDRIEVVDLRVIATAAAREAENGAAFVAEAERLCRVPIQVLSGRDEARCSALGVSAGIWKPSGLAGDLGGGSLELVEVEGDKIGNGVTLPLGGLRLQDASGRSLKRAASVVRSALDGCTLFEGARGRPFYAIGGTWRSLGRLHMFQTAYPLHVMHHYAVPSAEILEFCRLTGRANPTTLPGIEAVSEARRPLLGYGALVLAEILRRAEPSEVVFSAFGVREGLLYSFLDVRERARDPLLVAAEEYCLLRSRSPAHAHELDRWLDGLFQASGLQETDAERRLRRAACLLSDIGWRAHPDYRGEQSLNVVAHAAFVGVTHPERAFLALATFYRHVGAAEDVNQPRLRDLCSPRQIERARMIGLAFRVASALSASLPGVLPQTPLRVEGTRLKLTLTGSAVALNGRRVNSRLKQLARHLSLEAAIVVDA